jgi:outer membrane cobalamin receptor
LVTVASDSSQELTFALSPVLLNYSDVMVTSTKADRQLRDVAMPIAVVRAEQIDRLAPVSVTNALQSEPGLSLGRDGIWGTTPNVRGLARNHVVALVDGNRIDTANDLRAGLSMIDVNDIERIEVIKGAASSLYGSGAMGGVINIITRMAGTRINPITIRSGRWVRLGESVGIGKIVDHGRFTTLASLCLGHAAQSR